MKFVKAILAAGFVLSVSSLLSAQAVMPQKSPKSTVSYGIGGTQIAIEYSSPAVRDREVWGNIVPFDQVWRAGANDATTISFSTDVVVEGQKLAAGKYAFFLIPKEDGKWTAIFNKKTDQWGAYDYKEEEDVLRVEIPTNDSKVVEERLSYSIVDQDIDAGYIRMSWEKMRAYVRFRVDVMANWEAAVAAVEEKDRANTYVAAADYLMTSKDYYDKALEMVGKSIEIQPSPRNYWMKAQVHAAKAEVAEAVASANKALELGNANPEDRFFKSNKANIEKKLAAWQSED